MKPLDYGFKKVVDGPVDEVETKVRAALQSEGFGVLTEIDVRGAFAAKLGVDFPGYKILGACNPPLAHGALTHSRDIGLLLPCNVVVYDDDGATTVAILDPVKQLGVAGDEGLQDLAVEVRARMQRVLASL